MSCNIPVQKGVKNAADCKCYGAVMRTYKSMSDEPEHIAFDAALRVFRHHHPADSKADAKLTVESWLYAGEERLCH
ncbi:MAG: hypothetical protein KDJ35_00910 [Alphaproteobacteria bacterium]|nr:hypothetical protein [Alphaproteobacteria bacterium]